MTTSRYSPWKTQFYNLDTHKVRVSIVSGTIDANGDDVVIFNATTLTCTLPTAVGRTGRSYTIKNVFAGNLIIATTAAQTIDGAAPAVLAQWAIRRVMSDGANWITV